MNYSKLTKDALLKQIERLENELRELENNASDAHTDGDTQYRNLIEHSPEGVLVIQDGKLVFYNSILREYVGYTDEDLTLTDFTDFIHPDDVDAAVYFYTKMMNGENVPSSFEFRIASKDGSFIDMEIYVSFSHWMNKPAVFCYFRDISERKRFETDLKISNERWKSLFENSIDANFTTDLNGDITAANGSMEKILGYTKDELIHMNFRDIIDSGSVESAWRSFNKMFRTKKPVVNEVYTVRNKHGDVLMIEANANVIEENERIIGFQGSFRDITARKKAEDSLRESEEKYLTLLLNSKEGILVLQDEQVKFFNPKVLEITGYDEHEIRKLAVFELVHPEDLEAVANRYKRTMSGENMVDPYVYRIYRKGDELRWVKGTGVSITWDGKPADLTFLIDVTEQKLAQEALIRSEENLRNFFETSRDVLYISSIDGKIVEINNRAEDLSGYSRSELFEMSVIDLYKNPADRKRVMDMVINNGYVTDYEIEMLKKDGSIVHCLFTSTVRKDNEGTITGFQGSIQDVTEKKRIEQQLIHAQKMEALGNLAGGIAHNFNNILVGIMGYAEFLMHKKQEGDPDYKAVKTIFESTTRAADMTRQLLSVARAGEHVARRIQPESIVKNTLQLIKNLFDKNITINTHIQENIKPIIGDQGQLEQCLLNLCINARDAMTAGGELLIEVENRHIDEEDARSHLEAQTGDYVILSVSDTGIGMSPEVRKRIFEPFFTTKLDTGGTGMGLATLYGIIKNHNGFINVYSEENVGTTFKLYLPVSMKKVEKPQPEEAPETTEGTETILLIDDEHHVLDMWGDLLGESGYTVMIADDGAQGVEMYREHQDEIDLVILDYIMPGMGGPDVIERLMEIDPDVKILIASGYSENGHVKGILNNDIVGFIQKPATMKEILSKVRTAIDG